MKNSHINKIFLVTLFVFIENCSSTEDSTRLTLDPAKSTKPVLDLTEKNNEPEQTENLDEDLQLLREKNLSELQKIYESTSSNDIRTKSRLAVIILDKAETLSREKIKKSSRGAHPEYILAKKIQGSSGNLIAFILSDDESRKAAREFILNERERIIAWAYPQRLDLRQLMREKWLMAAHRLGEKKQSLETPNRPESKPH